MSNVYNKKLKPCNMEKITGYVRDGYCSPINSDSGIHIVCAIMTDNFLNFTQKRGNDLKTPKNDFPGLKSGDVWCICVSRWIEAYNYDPSFAPYIIGASTSKNILKFIPIEILRNYLVIN